MFPLKRLSGGYVVGKDFDASLLYREKETKISGEGLYGSRSAVL